MAIPRNSSGKVSPYFKYAGLAFQIGGTILVCVWIGKKIDAALSMERPVFTAVLALFGTVGGMYISLKDLIKKKV
jgi:hypothetical protein